MIKTEISFSIPRGTLVWQPQQTQPEIWHDSIVRIKTIFVGLIHGLDSLDAGG